MPTILITGAGGQLGQELQAFDHRYPNWTFLAPTRQSLDITDESALQAFFATHKPDYCLNTAAYTAVDKAEEEQEQAYAINAQAAAAIARFCLHHNTQLIHYSTDYVYKGDYNRPLLEDDATLGDGIYAQSKLQGDQLVLQELPAAMIIRTSWVYSSFGHNFVKTMLRLGKQRDALSVVFDQIGTPTYAYDLAAASLEIIKKIESGAISKQDASGVFHYSNEGVCSWYDFAICIFECSDIKCKVSPIESKDYPTPASRPHYSVLNKAKIKKTFDLNIPHWQDGLKRCLETIKKQLP